MSKTIATGLRKLMFHAMLFFLMLLQFSNITSSHKICYIFKTRCPWPTSLTRATADIIKSALWGHIQNMQCCIIDPVLKNLHILMFIIEPLCNRMVLQSYHILGIAVLKKKVEISSQTSAILAN